VSLSLFCHPTAATPVYYQTEGRYPVVACDKTTILSQACVLEITPPQHEGHLPHRMHQGGESPVWRGQSRVGAPILKTSKGTVVRLGHIRTNCSYPATKSPTPYAWQC